MSQENDTPTPLWTVLEHRELVDYLTTTLRAASSYCLCFNGKIQQRGKGPGEYQRFMNTAAHLNKIKATPRPKIQCAADSLDPRDYVKKHAG
jgi:hypothetical protein